ncbi:MAG TPA: ABC transporter ATP-binding protein [Terriglobales bacterium]|nr:ABC transporter ATP-binding protein [Terriglobales bacterium]
MGTSTASTQTRAESPAATKKLTFSRLLKPHLGSLTLGFIAIAGESAANLLQPWPLKIVLDDVLRSHSTHAWTMRMIHQIVGSDKIAILKFACIAVLGIAVLDAICTYGEKYLTTSVAQWVSYDLRLTIYSHIQRLSLAFHDHKRTGDLISRVTDDIENIQSFITNGLLGVLINAMTLVGMIAVMFWLNWQFTLIALSVVPALFAMVYIYTRRIKKASREVRKKEGEITSVVQEVLSSIRVVKAFAREDYEVRRLEQESLEAVEISLRARSLKAKLTPLVGIVVAVGTGLVLWFGARLVMSGSLTAGALVVFILYLGKMYKPMQEISKMTDTYSKAAVGYERIQEILNTRLEIKDLPKARKVQKLRGDIEFDHVSFAYTSDSPILKDVSFRMNAGNVSAFVGPTGAGKTSIISLLARFYDPDTGLIRIDGTDIKQFQQESLRQHMSFVLQETVLFHASVWQNIAYGKPGSTRAEIIKAAKMANADEFIEKLPEGYDTVLGERGMTLSGGQRQRIAIARAVIRNTPILLLDEPTSGLDSASEKLVFEALDRLMEGRTVVVIAHRLSTVQRADMIFVVDDGQIVERGKHQKLMKLNGIYAGLHNLQFRQEDSVELTRAS